MTGEDRSYTRTEVAAGGFEARCVGPDGTRYLWHGRQGIRVDPGGSVTTLSRRSPGCPRGPGVRRNSECRKSRRATVHTLTRDSAGLLPRGCLACPGRRSPSRRP